MKQVIGKESVPKVVGCCVNVVKYMVLLVGLQLIYDDTEHFLAQMFDKYEDR